MILGIDEVGRGPWAGPLVVGAVVLGDAQIEGLTDSKKLSKKRRELLAAQIHEQANAVGLGWVSAAELDQLGMSESLRLATRRAARQIKTPFHEIIIDGTINFLGGTPLESHVTTLAKADLLIGAVSAASIIAKVARDEYMAAQQTAYPQYGFEKHAGYGTAAHRAAITVHGVTPLHRLSFAPLRRYATSVPIVEQPATVTTRAIGDASESVAAEYLASKGFEIIERNWRTKASEIDIVARRDGVWWFVEVKHRRRNTSGDGVDAITPTKRRQMERAAKMYLHYIKRDEAPARLVVVATTEEPPVVATYLELV